MDLEKNFIYHPPSKAQTMIYTEIRKAAHDFAQFIQSSCVDSRERSLALTNLEQTVMWANASIARNGDPKLSKDDLTKLLTRKYGGVYGHRSSGNPGVTYFYDTPDYDSSTKEIAAWITEDKYFIF